MTQTRREAMFKKKLEQLVKSRKYYLKKKHPKKYKGKKRGRKPQRVEQTLQANHACQWRNCHRTAGQEASIC